MFGVDRQDRHPSLGGQPHDVVAAHDERLLVGQRDFLARFDGGHRGQQTRVSHQRVDHRVDRVGLHYLPDRVGTRVDLDGAVGQRAAQRVVFRVVGDDHRIGREFLGLTGQRLPVAVRGERGDFEQFGVLADDVERLDADRTGRTEQGDTLFHAWGLSGGMFH